MCRLKNGDIVAVFYAGYQHVSLPKPPEWPNGGRICLVRSRDEGRTWSPPRTIFDDASDNRDPHIAELPDGRLALTFFSLIRNDGAPNNFEGTGVKLAYSHDGGASWDSMAQTLVDPREKWYCSAPVRVLPSGTWLLGVYKYNPPAEIYGGVLRSTDQGKTWSRPISIGKEANLPLDAETDVVPLKDGSIFAALRCGKPGMGMRYATSKDDGKSWTPVLDAGFHGESPYLYRMKNRSGYELCRGGDFYHRGFFFRHFVSGGARRDIPSRSADSLGPDRVSDRDAAHNTGFSAAVLPDGSRFGK
jgi:hypothetical protein